MEKQSGLSEFLNNHGNKLGIALALLIGVGAGVAAYMSTDAPTESHKPISKPIPDREQRPASQIRTIPSPQNPVSSFKPSGHLPPQYNTQFERLAQMVQRELSQQGVVGMESIMAIIQIAGQICTPEFVKTFTEGRANRRAVKDTDRDQYAEILIATTENLESLLDERVKDILIEVGIDLDKYQASCEYWARANPQFGMMAMGQMEMLKAAVQSTNEITRDLIIEYLNFCIDQYPNMKAQKVGEIPAGLIKKSLLDDLAFETYGIEEEDILKYMQSQGIAAMQDQELFGLLQTFQTNLQNDMMSEMQG